MLPLINLWVLLFLVSCLFVTTPAKSRCLASILQLLYTLRISYYPLPAATSINRYTRVRIANKYLCQMSPTTTEFQAENQPMNEDKKCQPLVGKQFPFIMNLV